MNWIRKSDPQNCLLQAPPTPAVSDWIAPLSSRHLRFPLLSVQQDEGLQFLWDVSPVVEAVLDYGPGS